jgi:NAD(P)-dependent dehydrogenase (short-subunit alcohol dehydrogenase family)
MTSVPYGHYADRFARRGHDLELVARNRARMEALADRLRREAGVAVDILRADLTDARELAQVEASVARGYSPRHPGQQRGASVPRPGRRGQDHQPQHNGADAAGQRRRATVGQGR